MPVWECHPFSFTKGFVPSLRVKRKHQTRPLIHYTLYSCTTDLDSSERHELSGFNFLWVLCYVRKESIRESPILGDLRNNKPSLGDKGRTCYSGTIHFLSALSRIATGEPFHIFSVSSVPLQSAPHQLMAGEVGSCDFTALPQQRHYATV